MKKSGFLFSAILLYFNVSAQSEKINYSDTISYNSSIDAVYDTLPNLNLFVDETPMDLTLKYDITAFIRNKMKGEYLDAELLVHYKNYTETKNIRLKARGNNRREQCFFPPIFLNFENDPIVNSELERFNKIKLVTHCSTSKSYTDYLLKEYLAYKLYNVLTDNSFRVQLLDIKYIDTGKKERNYDKYGILIEPIELLVARKKSIEVNGEIIRENNVIEEEADIVALFQYMIGNTDWRIKGGHNIKYIKSLTKLTDKVTPIPYDFDFAGFVGAHYSHPQSWTSIKSVKEREYLGYCRNSDEAYLKTINLFLDKKDQMIKSIESFSYVSVEERERLIKYIESFYVLLNNPNRFISTLKSQCRIDF
jgi:hypothetical protein